MTLSLTATARTRPASCGPPSPRGLRPWVLSCIPGRRRSHTARTRTAGGTSEHTSFDFLGYTFRGRLAKGPRGYLHRLLPGHQRQGEEGERQADQGLAPQPPQQRGPVRPGPGDQSPGPRLDQLLRSLLPLRVVLPGMAHQRAPGPVGHAQVQAIPRQVRQSDGLAAEGLPVQAWPVRPLAADRVHLRPDCGGRMTGDCQSAGINRHGDGDGRALRRRSSDPRWP